MPDTGDRSFAAVNSRVEASSCDIRTRLKNEVHAILHANLIGRCPVSDLFTAKGRKWLAKQSLSSEDREAIERGFREIRPAWERLAALDRGARYAVESTIHGCDRLMTITGIDMISGSRPPRDHWRSHPVLVSGEAGELLGPQPQGPTVREWPARHGRITKRGANQARALLVEAAWAASRAPGPLRSFFLRVMSRRGSQVAAVATARKLAVIVWHVLSRQEDYVFARPSLVARKRRSTELRAGRPQQRGRRGIAGRYNTPVTRSEERSRLEQAEQAYERVVTGWRASGPRTRSRDGSRESNTDR